MARLLKIARMGHPVLRRRAEPVDDWRDPEVQTLASDMVATMIDANGVGLAAPQVYDGRRVIVFRVPEERRTPEEEPVPDAVTVLLNPVIEPEGTEQVLGAEGCLSIPGLKGLVPRWSAIRYRGRSLDGTAVERRATGFHARVIQHEVDHLDGILYLDRMNDLRPLAFDGEFPHLLAAMEGTENVG